MIVVSLLLFLAGVGLLAAGLVTASIALEVGAIGAALLSGVALYFGVRQRRPATAPGQDGPAEQSWRTASRRSDSGPPPETPAEPPADQEPEEESVSPADAARIAARTDNVLVVDGRPRYHLAGCPSLAESEIVLFPVGEARSAGFTPCARCRPDAHLLAGGGPPG